MHSCAFASDILFHQYRISLKNVFDLEVFIIFDCIKFQAILLNTFLLKVAYVFVSNYSDGECLSNSIAIDLLIEQNLPNVEQHRLLNQKVDHINIDWSKRPLNSMTKYIVLRETSYLIELYKKFYDRIFEKFSKGCDLYLNIIRNCDTDEKLNKIYQVAVKI
jgi:hypothetical protein